MPRLVTLLPCERVMFGEDQTVSLIVVLAEIHFRILPGNPPPPFESGVVTFYKWSIFSQWELDMGEDRSELQQKVVLAFKDGREVFANIADLGIPDSNTQTHRMIASLEVIPMLPEGDYKLIANWKRSEEH